MPAPPTSRVLLALTCLTLTLAGCSTGETGDRSDTRSPTPRDSATDRAPQTSREPASENIPLLINGEPVPWSTLRPMLAEAGGGVVVDEVALEHALRRELRARGLTVTNEHVRAERARWAELLGDELAAETEPSIRRRRGLGPVRFGRMLWRNAALRALLDPGELAVSDNELAMAREIRAGTRYAVTGVVAPDSRTALGLARAAGDDARGAIAGLWATAAAERLRPWHGLVSPSDPAYPEALRRALPSTRAGRTTGVVALDNGYGVAVVHAVIPPDPGSVDDAELREELRIRKTRLAMERLARRLLDRTTVHAMDRSLSASE